MSWTRRDFLGTSLLGLVAGTFPRLLAAATYGTREFVELRRNVGIFTERGGTIGWLVTPTGAALVDSQYPDSAQNCATGLEARGVTSLDALINTHHHGDHTGGNSVFSSTARRIVAHERVPELQRRAAEQSESDTPQTYADTTFERQWSLPIGDEMVRAKHYGRAHTGGDCIVHFENAGVVHMGDLVFNRAYPFVDRAGGASMEGWIRVLETATAEYPDDTIYVFGHAFEGFDPTGSRADVLLQRDFLTAALEHARSAAAAGWDRDEATALDQLPGFEEHGALADWLSLASVLGAAYDELAG